MRAMAAILIQSIGMTPGGISPQILIRFNVIHLPVPELIQSRGVRDAQRVNNQKIGLPVVLMV